MKCSGLKLVVPGYHIVAKLPVTLVRRGWFIVFKNRSRFFECLPLSRTMLWSEIGKESRIKQAGMDGSESKVLISYGLNWPIALAVDIVTDRIYWADEKLKYIGSATMNGNDISVNLSFIFHLKFSCLCSRKTLLIKLACLFQIKFISG